MWTGGPDVAVNSSKSAVYLSASGLALDPKAKLVTMIMIDGEIKKVDTVKATGIGAQMVSQVKYSFIGLQ
jgi:protein subunit release factor A